MPFNFLFLILLLTMSCNRENSALAKSESDWKKLRCGLYINGKGEIGFPTDPEIAHVPKESLKSERCPNVFITAFGYGPDSLKLRDIVDSATFRDLGSSYFRDKNRIYLYYALCSGGYLHIFADEPDSFAVLGAGYAKYRSKIYYFRSGELDADAQSFRVFEKIGPIAKDSAGYFLFDERISEDSLKKHLGEHDFKKLKTAEK